MSSAKSTTPDSPLPCSKSAVNKLGKRLAQPGPITSGDRSLLAEVLDAYSGVLAHAVTRVSEIVTDYEGEEGVALTLTSRPKTTQTIREKLQRDRTRLATMQDIAGMRIVGAITRRQQDVLGSRIAAEFTSEETSPAPVDRRHQPSHGYRALHVMVFPAGVPIEVQIRTEGQDAWAQLVEDLGDRWGAWDQVRRAAAGAGPCRVR